MTATDTQARILMREHQKGKTQEQAAASGNLRYRTVRGYKTEVGMLNGLLSAGTGVG